MFFTKSIRWRLQLWHGLILLAVLGGFGVTAWRLQQQRVLRTAEERLQERLNTAMNTMRQYGPAEGGRPPRPGPGPGPGGDAGRPPRPGPGPGFGGDGPPPGNPDNPPPREGPPGEGRPSRPEFPAHRPAGLEEALKADESPGGTVTAWRRDGFMLGTTSSNPPETKPPRATTKSVITITQNRMELLAASPPGETILVTRDLQPDLDALRRTAWQLAAAGAGVLLLGLAGGWWAAGRSLRPISRISATAERLSAGNLGERLRLEDPHDELGQLAGVLNAMLGRLDASFTQQTRFISDAAHELRTPVTVMLTQTQTALRRDRPAAEYRQSLEACQRAAGRMRQLIESLLALARLDAGQQQMKRLRFDLARAAADQVELLTPLAAARQITIHSELAPVSMEGDPDYLSLVIANLLTNAIHYNRDEGRIRVVLKREAGEAVLTVSDTGEGMTEYALSHIFDRFFRADQSRSLPAGRTGLGLAITKSIVEVHRGTILVESTPGQGTTFTVRLPMTVSDEAAAA